MGRRYTVTAETNEIAQNTSELSANAQHGDGNRGGFGGAVTAIASAVALMFSAVSLYHSVLKQPELQFYVAPVVHYMRDNTAGVEVFAVPMTIANHGARDGAVLSIDLEVGNKEGTVKNFYSGYFVDGDFFVAPARYNMQTRSYDRVDRPKQPFAPISVAGRGNYTGTILFYSRSKSFPRLVYEKGEFSITVTLNTRLDNSLGPIDRLLRNDTKPITFVANLARYDKMSVTRGEPQRMNKTDWTTGVAETVPRKSQ